jgi:hypothetical protein
VLQPIFNAGRIRGQVARAEALQQEALTRTRNRSSAHSRMWRTPDRSDEVRQIRAEQAKNVEALRRFRDLADLRYREGATIYLEVANADNRCSTPNSRMSPHNRSSFSRTRICTRRWVAAGSKMQNGSSPAEIGAVATEHQEPVMGPSRYRSRMGNIRADTCDSCSSACVREDDVTMMAECIRLDLDCAAIC